MAGNFLCPVTVTYASQPGTAASTDYAVPDGTVTFPTNTPSGTVATIALGLSAGAMPLRFELERLHRLQQQAERLEAVLHEIAPPGH